MKDQFEFPGIVYNEKQIPLTLTPLLHRGGAACDLRKFWDRLAKGGFGPEISGRFAMVVLLFRPLSNIISTGGSLTTLKSAISGLRKLYKFSDSRGLDINPKNAVSAYRLWISEIYKKSRAQGRSEISLGDYGQASSIATLLGECTGLGRDLFINKSKLRAPRKTTAALGAKVDRQDLAKTKDFAETLIDITRSLSAKSCLSRLPVIIKFRNGVTTEHYASLNQHAANLSSDAPQLHNISPAVRYPLYNLRVEAEMMIFISQTSMNIGDAAKLKIQNFRYKSVDGMTEVYAYKGRKKGQVLFTIFNEYKPFFIAFLKFRKEIGLDQLTDKVFGRIPQPGMPLSSIPHARSLHSFLRRRGISHVSATMLRKTRQNWLARQMGDLEAAAEIGQHDVHTYARYYNRPHHQTAAVEFATYFQTLGQVREAVVGGECAGESPQLIASAPAGMDKPNCLNPALCLFCDKYKGVRSYDYIWALLTFLKLKRFESLCGALNDDSSAVVSRAQEISEQFKAVNSKCCAWQAKAEAQVAQGAHHPNWAGYFDIIELRAM